MSLTRARKHHEKLSGNSDVAAVEKNSVKLQETEITLRPQKLRRSTVIKTDLSVPLIGRIGGSHLSMRHWRVPEVLRVANELNSKQ